MTTNLIRKTSKLKEKTQNSSKKLMVWEALAPYVSPSDVKKRACSSLKMSIHSALAHVLVNSKIDDKFA